MTTTDQEVIAYREHFDSIDWGDLPASQAYAVYALGLYLNHPDFAALGTDSLTDGPDDKKIDFCYFDEESGQAYCGQSYLAENWGRPAAPANKAADLSAGVTWLLASPFEDVPERLRPVATELREGIRNGTVTRLNIIFSHNCHESANVQTELTNVARTAGGLLDHASVAIAVKELGVESLTHLYESLDRDILVEDHITLPIDGQYGVAGDRWEAVVATVSGLELRALARQYGDDLYSANIRGFLGILRRRGNINSKIRNTIASEPESFWAYNNGITVLTRDISVEDGNLRASGISVINGAQTMGVLGESEEEDATRVRVSVRFIKCDDESVIQKIIQYNNTQNEIKSFDLRSTDTVQRQLAQEFQRYDIPYIHRRSATRRPPAGAIQASVIGQSLCSFGGDLQTAIRQRSNIFEDDGKYAEVFPQAISAEHLYLVQCLSDAIDVVKAKLRSRVAEGDATELEEQRGKLFGYSTAKQFVISVIGAVSSQLLGRRVVDLKAWRCRSNVVRPDRSDMVQVWVSVLERLLPKIVRYIGDEPSKAVRSTESMRRVVAELADRLEGFGDEYAAVLTSLRETTTS